MRQWLERERHACYHPLWEIQLVKVESVVDHSHLRGAVDLYITVMSCLLTKQEKRTSNNRQVENPPEQVFATSVLLS